jgi:hypothetical protein
MCDLVPIRVPAHPWPAEGSAPATPASSPLSSDRCVDELPVWDHDQYDQARALFPRNPDKHNTTPAQNILGLVANLYQNYLDGTPPQEACKLLLKKEHDLYNLEWLRSTPENLQLNVRLYDVFLADTPGIARRMDRLLDLAIQCVCSRVTTECLTMRLALLVFCDI